MQNATRYFTLPLKSQKMKKTSVVNGELLIDHKASLYTIQDAEE